MDPQEALRLFTEAVEGKRYTEAMRHRADLVSWIEMGGFQPDFDEHPEWSFAKVKNWTKQKANREEQWQRERNTGGPAMARIPRPESRLPNYSKLNKNREI